MKCVVFLSAHYFSSSLWGDLTEIKSYNQQCYELISTSNFNAVRELNGISDSTISFYFGKVIITYIFLPWNGTIATTGATMRAHTIFLCFCLQVGCGYRIMFIIRKAKRAIRRRPLPLLTGNLCWSLRPSCGSTRSVHQDLHVVENNFQDYRAGSSC